MPKKKARYVTIDGLYMRVGSLAYKWFMLNRKRIEGWLKKHKRHVKRHVVKLPLQGCDYVAGPDPATLKKAGIQFVVRYISTPGNPKNITRTELLELHKAGIEVALVFETTADRARYGAKAGAADAQSAQQQVAALGFPNAVVYFAVDFDPHGHETTIVSYIHAAAQVLGVKRTGVYGGLNAVKAVLDAKVANYGWQTLAWSYGKWDPRRHLEQYANGQKIAGHSVDLDRALKRSYGAL